MPYGQKTHERNRERRPDLWLEIMDLGCFNAGPTSTRWPSIEATKGQSFAWAGWCLRWHWKQPWAAWRHSNWCQSARLRDKWLCLADNLCRRSHDSNRILSPRQYWCTILVSEISIIRGSSLSLKALIYFVGAYINHRDEKGGFQFEIVINMLADYFRLIWICMLWVYGH